MSNYSIRRADWEDKSEILTIKKQVHDLYIERRSDVYRDSEILYTDYFLKSFFENDQRIILVAILDDEIVAYSFLESMNIQLPMLVERKYIYIHDFAVAKKFRQQGVATLMLKYIEKYAVTKGVLKIELAVHLFSEDAIRLYEKIGFTPRAIRMEKDLSEGNQ